MLLVCVDCLFPLHDVLKPTEKRHRWPAGNSFSCSAKMASVTDRQEEHRQEERLPRWATAVKQVLLIQPSSAAAERVFSILKASFNEQQDCALVDYIQASVMAQYNKR